MNILTIHKSESLDGHYEEILRVDSASVYHKVSLMIPQDGGMGCVAEVWSAADLSWHPVVGLSPHDRACGNENFSTAENSAKDRIKLLKLVAAVLFDEITGEHYAVEGSYKHDFEWRENG